MVGFPFSVWIHGTILSLIMCSIHALNKMPLYFISLQKSLFGANVDVFYYQQV